MLFKAGVAARSPSRSHSAAFFRYISARDDIATAPFKGPPEARGAFYFNRKPRPFTALHDDWLFKACEIAQILAHGNVASRRGWTVLLLNNLSEQIRE